MASSHDWGVLFTAVILQGVALSDANVVKFLAILLLRALAHR